MAPNEAFLDACADGDLQKMQQATANDSPTAEDLDEGLALATEGAHPEVVAALFAAGATVSGQALDFLPGKDCKQSPIVIRHFLDQGMSPNVRLSNGEPLLRYAPHLATPVIAADKIVTQLHGQCRLRPRAPLSRRRS
jgi:hypothetical protein